MVGIPSRLLAQTPFGDLDSLYARLLDAHAGLSPEASARLNARLVLLLADHVRDERVLADAIARAMAGLEPAAGGGRG